MSFYVIRIVLIYLGLERGIWLVLGWIMLGDRNWSIKDKNVIEGKDEYIKSLEFG